MTTRISSLKVSFGLCPILHLFYSTHFFLLLYSLLPIYPVRVITTCVFLATFMMLSVVYITTYISKGVTLKDCKGTRLDSSCLD